MERAIHQIQGRIDEVLSFPRRTYKINSHLPLRQFFRKYCSLIKVRSMIYTSMYSGTWIQEEARWRDGWI